MNLTYSFNGLDEFAKVLNTLDSKVQKNIAQRAVTKAIRIGKKAVENAAPVGTNPRSQSSQIYGPLETNIKIQRVKKNRKNSKAARVVTGKAFWGQFYELGTAHQAPRPWFTPAFISAIPEMMNDLAENLEEGITKEFTS